MTTVPGIYKEHEAQKEPEPKCRSALPRQLEDHLAGKGPHIPPHKQSPILLCQVRQEQLEETIKHWLSVKSSLIESMSEVKGQ